MPAKLSLFGSLFLLSMLYSDILFLLSIIATCLILAILANLGQTTKAYVRAFLFFSALVFAINILVNQSGQTALFQISFRFYWWNVRFRITLESLLLALRMVLRLLAVILSFLLFTLTTKPEKLLHRLSAIRGLERLGLVLALAYRFLPTLLSDGRDMKDSLMTRGVSFEDVGRLERIRSYAQLGIPLVVNGLDRSLQLAEAMESRGYASGRRTRQARIPSTLGDRILFLFYLIVLGTLCAFWLLFGIGRVPMRASCDLLLSGGLITAFVTPVALRRLNP